MQQLFLGALDFGATIPVQALPVLLVLTPLLLHSSRLQILVLLAQHISLWKLIEDPCPLYGRRFYRGDRLVHRCRAPLLCLGRLVWRLPLKCTPQDSEKLQACQKWGSCPAADGSGLQCQDLPRLKEASMNWETSC